MKKLEYTLSLTNNQAYEAKRILNAGLFAGKISSYAYSVNSGVYELSITPREDNTDPIITQIQALTTKTLEHAS